MKKLLLLGVLTLLFVLSCGGKKEETKDQKGSAEEPKKTEKLVVGATPVPHQELLELVKDDLKNEALRKVHLFNKKEMHPSSLSGGEKQRLLLAMSMVSQKPIIVFDEPTSGLCKMQMDILIGFLNQMVEQGKTIIIITHDFEFIKQCDGAIYEFTK